MSEVTDNGQEKVDETTTEAMPTSDQPTEQEEQIDDLPEDVSERTRLQFEKLKAANKELAERLALQEQPKPQFSSVLDELYPKSQAPVAPSQDQAKDYVQGLVDKEGYIDPDQLNKTLQDSDERAKRAELEAKAARERVEKFEETQTVNKVHGLYPQLDPYHKDFDPLFYDYVKKDMIGQLMEGKQDYLAAAKSADSFFKKAQARQAKEAETQKVISQREQAAATTGTAKPISNTGEYERQQVGIRQGDSLSIGQRLIDSGY
jgi:hypothetical protein